MKLFGEDDNDLISITAYWGNTIGGGDGSDTIALEGGSQHSISGGAGADRISLGTAASSTVYYATGDGNDTVWGFNTTDLLTVPNNYSTEQKGSDLNVKVGSGSVLLKDAVKLGTVNINGKTVTIGEDKTVTQQEVIKNFMTALDKSTSTNATTLLDNAVKTASNGKFTTIQKAIDAMVKDCQYSASGDEFLRNYCGIILNNEDTGAISGADAGGRLKTAKSVITESGTKSSLDRSKYDSYYVWYDDKNSGLIIGYADAGTVTKDKQHIMDCAYTWWASEAVKLIDESYGYSFSDLRSHEGMMRNLIIRTTSTGELMLIVVARIDNDEEMEKFKTLLQFVADKFPQITSLQYVINNKVNDSIGDLDTFTFKGRDHIFEEMEGLIPSQIPPGNGTNC